MTAPVTTRRLLAWADAVQGGFPSKYAFRVSILQGSDAADSEKLRELERATLETGHKTIDSIRDGSWTFLPPTLPVENSDENPFSSAADARAANDFRSAPSI